MLKILTAPHPALKKKATPVTNVTAQDIKFLDDMLNTMYVADGIGLAAPQVGVSKRMIVVDVENPQRVHPYQMINPEIIWKSDIIKEYEEGCLSFPSEYAGVKRPDAVHVRYLDTKGQEQVLKADGLLAVCVQHEIDHLDGINFVDHISRLKRDLILKRLIKSQK